MIATHANDSSASARR